MDSKRVIKKLSSGNKFKSNLINIITDMNLFSDKVIDLMEISYDNVMDSQLITFVISEELYNILVNLTEPCILRGRKEHYFHQDFIYLNDLTKDDGQVLYLSSDDVCVLYHPMGNLEDKNTTLEQDNLLNYFDNNREILGLRNCGMNLIVKDIKNLINFEQRFYNQQIDTFNLIKNGNELNIIYNDNGIIKCVVNFFVIPRNYTDNYIPINTYFNHVNSNQYEKRKVGYYE